MSNEPSTVVGHDDLYGDLEETMGSAPVRSDCKPATHQINIQQEREDIRNLKKELERIKKENGVLKQNMGTLYRTAKKELERKDARIVELERELNAQRGY